jgi:poly-gamma-glutamate synthesis protein (capsule biosynthesis protein)
MRLDPRVGPFVLSSDVKTQLELPDLPSNQGSELRAALKTLLATAAIAVVGCGDGWPDPETVYPWVYTPEEAVEEYQKIRWETETWEATSPLEAGLYLKKWLLHRPGAAKETLEHFDAMRPQLPALGKGVVLSFVGDIMWIGADWSGFAAPVSATIAADLRIGNLETPTSSKHAFGKEGIPTRYNASPEMLDGIPFDLLQLNNNHSLDLGDPGLEATVAAVKARGIRTVGVDAQALVEVAGTTIAFLAYSWGVNRRDLKSAHDLFIVPFGHIGQPIDLSPIEAGIEASRLKGATRVVVLVHWGFEYEYYPDPHFLQLARRIIALGADVIVGQGPHVVQPAELCYVNHLDRVPGVGSCSLRTSDGVARRAAVLYSLAAVTPRSIRIRKLLLDHHQRMKEARAGAA